MPKRLKIKKASFGSEHNQVCTTLEDKNKRLSTPCFDMPSEVKCSVKKIDNKISAKDLNSGEVFAWRETFRPSEEHMTFRSKAESAGKKLS